MKILTRQRPGHDEGDLDEASTNHNYGFWFLIFRLYYQQKKDL